MSIKINKVAISKASSEFPLRPSFVPSYGTAGFRAHASLLASTVYRCGLLVACRSIITGQSCGLMITASHNPIEDNGVKLIEPDGGMLPQSWEPIATELAQCTSDEQVALIVERILTDHPSPASAPTITSPAASPCCFVLIGHDTRPSAPELLVAARAGVSALSGGAAAAAAAGLSGATTSSGGGDDDGVAHHAGPQMMEAGLVTTPQLHFMVHAINQQHLHSSSTPAAAASSSPSSPSPTPVELLTLYFDTLLGAFEDLVKGLPASPLPLPAPPPPPLHVDCANGVGAVHLRSAAARLTKSGLVLRLHNDSRSGEGLNQGCGADYVQKERVLPSAFCEVTPASDTRCCSIDGDADRLVFFFPEEPLQGGETVAGRGGGGGGGGRRIEGLLDGDKIAILAAVYVGELLKKLPSDVAEGIKVGVIQTAYANGASTSYIQKELGLEVQCTPTGVKHLHEAAHHYDVGIYWEANGHGTVLFSKGLLDRLEKARSISPAAEELLLLSRVINQTVGDAISGILLVEAVLRCKSWSLREWNGLYKDLPSRQSKLKVADRNAITTTDAERRCVTPPGLQDAIDRLVSEYSSSSSSPSPSPPARAFVRPSGTEDAVRVYAEAGTQQEADELALRVGRAVYDLAGGVGGRP